MIALEIRRLAGGEVLHACPQYALDKPLPCIIFYHGFTSSKRVYSYFAVALAEAGFRVIMPDAPEHGARYDGDDRGRMQRFWPILLQNFAEFPALREAVIGQGWVEGDRLAVAGASMGGHDGAGNNDPPSGTKKRGLSDGLRLFYQALAEPGSLRLPSVPNGWLSGMSLSSSARWPTDRYCSGTARKMTWCRPEGTFRLQQALRQNDLDTHLTCIWQKGVRHRITPEALAATVAFFQRSL